MRIFVTGATGFVGAAFCRHALANGHQVAGLISPSKIAPALGAKTNAPVWLQGRLEQLPITELKTFQPEVCVHSAWISTPGEYLESPLNERHVRWGEALVKAMAQIGVRYFLGVGTCLEYAPSSAPLLEDVSPTADVTAYARAKNLFREQLFAAAPQGNFAAAWGRIFYPYGPGEPPAKLCTSLIQKFRRGEQLVLKTPTSTKDYIHIDDLASAMLTTVERQFTGMINWGTSTGTSIRTIADSIAAQLGCPELVAEVKPRQIDPLGYVVADTRRLNGLGWKPKIDLATGINGLIAAV